MDEAPPMDDGASLTLGLAAEHKRLVADACAGGAAGPRPGAPEAGGAALAAVVGAWRHLAPEADGAVVAWCVSLGLGAPLPPPWREGPDGSLRCAAARAFAAGLGCAPRRTPEWGVDDGAPDAPVRAVWAGQLGLLLSLPEGRDWPPACDAAAVRGDVEALRCLRSRSPPSPWGEATCEAAARHELPDVVAWLRAQDPPCPWGAGACAAAASSRLPGVLAWLRAQRPPCPWSRAECRARAWAAEVRAWIDAQAD